MDISVLTNSDYIMEKMLKNSNVSNISGSYLSENKTGTMLGIPLDPGKSRVCFGYVIHKDEEPEECIQEFLDFLTSRLSE